MREGALGRCGEVDKGDASIEKNIDISVAAVGDEKVGTWGDCDGGGRRLLASRAREGDVGNAEEKGGESISSMVMAGCGYPASVVSCSC